MVDVVGLRFVTTGEKEAIRALEAYGRGQKTLADLQDKHVAAFNRVIRAQEQSKRAYDQLAGSLDPNVAAANRLASAQKTLQTAFEQGVISAQKKAAMLRQLNAQYKADELNRYAAAQRKVSDTIIQGDAAVKRLSGDMQLLTERLKQGTITQQQHDTALKALARQLAINNNYIKANGALNTQKAMAELRATEATRAAATADAAAAANKARLSQSYNQLLASINPVIARQQQTRQTVDMLRAAVAAGAITTTQAAQALLQYRNALRQMDAANQLATRGMNRLGVLTQQAGYQFGDFAVQVQSGTNVMVALGQQATQLVGTLAMLSRSTRNIAIFSALGVAVPVTTAIAGGLMRAKVEADAIYEKFGFLEGAVRGLGAAFSQTGSFIINILSTMYRNLDVFVTILGVSAVAAVVKFTAATAAMGTLLTATQLLFSGLAGAQLVAASATATLTAAMSRLMVVISAHPIISAMTAALAIAVAVLYRARDASDGFRSNVEGLSEALKKLRDNAREAGLEAARIELGADTDAQAIAMQRILELDKQIVAQQERLQTVQGHDRRNAERRLRALELEREEIEKLLTADQKRVEALQKAETQSSLDAIISSYDEQYAIQVRILSAQKQLNTAVDLGLISPARAVKIMEAYEARLSEAADTAGDTADAVGGITANLSNAVNEALRLRDAMDAVGRASLGRQDQIAVLRAQINAARGGLNTEVAKTKTETALELARGGATLDQIATAVTTAGQEESTIQELTKTLRDLTAPSGGTSGSSGGAAATQDDYLKNLLLEAEQKRKLVGLSEEETRRQEILFELKKRDLLVNDALSEQQALMIEQIVQEEAQKRRLMEAEQQREQLMQTIEGNIKSAFMSMVDGSQSVEDAFRNMLRNILLAVYEQQVAQPAATGIGNLLSKGLSSLFGPGMTTGTPLQIPSSGVQSLLPSANGTAWSNGVQFFANGGVVGSPTMFGHSGGLGVMGEAGPEAIMPLKRGSDGKLGVSAGGGGSLTVNVVMDPSTGALGAFVQEQAGQVVAKAAPQLAQYASKTMVDQRRRGGTMKAAFRG